VTDALPAIEACKHCGSPAFLDRPEATDYWVFAVECERCDAVYGGPSECYVIEGWNMTYRSPEEARRQEAHKVVSRIRDVAKSLGWAVGIHGSLVRDIDLIAVPWTPEAVSLQAFLKGIQEGVGYSPMCDLTPNKPHGRRAQLMADPKATYERTPKGTWTPACIDLSLMDPREVPPTAWRPGICPSCHRVSDPTCGDPWHKPIGAVIP